MPWARYNESVVNTPASQALAKKACDDSLVLLKNDAHTLPLVRAPWHPSWGAPPSLVTCLPPS